MPFCAVMVDNALEHINSIVKVTRGIIQDASVLGFLITAPELGRLTEEAHKMAGPSTARRKEHDNISMAVWTRQAETLLRLANMMRSSRNPMTYEGTSRDTSTLHRQEQAHDHTRGAAQQHHNC